MWTKKPIVIDRQASLVFSWHLPNIVKLAKQGKIDKIGGPAVKVNPHFVPEQFRDTSDSGNWLSLHNPNATRTSLGCIRKCSFCVVHKIEPEFKEIDNFIPKPILCDNNFLACSKKHIIRSIDKLFGISGVDFNQGLDARLFKSWHIDEFKKLKWDVIRFAWDSANQESYVLGAIEKLKKAGFPASKIRCYVLVGFKESQEEATYRCETLREIGIIVSPMKYQPTDALAKDIYNPLLWNVDTLNKFCRYWARQRWFKYFTFDEFLDHYHKSIYLSPFKQWTKETIGR